eukprot:m51a1_g13787 hypothetical protein (159) ;mRNA; r:331406-331995
MVRIVNGVIVGDDAPPDHVPGHVASGITPSAGLPRSEEGQQQSTSPLRTLQSSVFNIGGRDIPNWWLILIAIVVYLLLGFSGLLFAASIAFVYWMYKRNSSMLQQQQQMLATQQGGYYQSVPQDAPRPSGQQPQGQGHTLGIRTMRDLPQGQGPNGPN